MMSAVFAVISVFPHLARFCCITLERHKVIHACESFPACHSFSTTGFTQSSTYQKAQLFLIITSKNTKTCLQLESNFAFSCQWECDIFHCDWSSKL